MFDLTSIKTTRTLSPPRVVLYGPHGVGKTTFGAGAPNPIFIPTEDGLGKIQAASFPLCTSWDEAISAIQSLAEGEHEFSAAVFDSLDWMEPLIQAETAKRNGWTSIEQPGFGKGYVATLEVWREFLDALSYLRDNRGMSIIIIAHCEIKQFQDPTSEAYDRYQIKVHKSAAALVEEWADAVLFATHKVYIEKKETGFKREVIKGTGLGERVMYTEERPAHRAKNRYGLPYELPLTWDALQAAIAAETVA